MKTNSSIVRTIEVERESVAKAIKSHARIGARIGRKAEVAVALVDGRSQYRIYCTGKRDTDCAE